MSFTVHVVLSVGRVPIIERATVEASVEKLLRREGLRSVDMPGPVATRDGLVWYSNPSCGVSVSGAKWLASFEKALKKCVLAASARSTIDVEVLYDDDELSTGAERARFAKKLRALCRKHRGREPRHVMLADDELAEPTRTRGAITPGYTHEPRARTKGEMRTFHRGVAPRGISWSVAQSGKWVLTSTRKINAWRDESSKKELATPQAARRAMEEMIAEKLAAGFREVWSLPMTARK